jgi:sodium-dependent dicarboxylate transporter 2/3/5
MVVLWIAGTWVKALSTITVAVVGAAILFLPGVRLLDWRRAQSGIGWESLMMIGGVSSLSIACRDTGLATFLVDSLLSGLTTWPTYAVLLAISAATVLIHLPVPIAPAVNAVLIPPIVELAQRAGVNPALYALPVAFAASCAFLLPLDAVALITLSKGHYRMSEMALPGALVSAAWIVVMSALLMLIGPMMGWH